MARAPFTTSSDDQVSGIDADVGAYIDAVTERAQAAGNTAVTRQALQVAGVVWDALGDTDVLVVFLDRTDSVYWRNDVTKSEAFIAAIDPAPTLEFELQATATDRLRIWRVAGRPTPRDGG